MAKRGTAAASTIHEITIYCAINDAGQVALSLDDWATAYGLEAFKINRPRRTFDLKLRVSAPTHVVAKGEVPEIGGAFTLMIDSV